MSLTCTRRRLQRDPAISHSSTLLRDLGIRALPQVDVRHVLPSALGASIHAQCRVGELDLGLVRFDVPLLLRLVGDGLPASTALAELDALDWYNAHTTRVAPAVRVFGTITNLVSCLEVM